MESDITVERKDGLAVVSLAIDVAALFYQLFCQPRVAEHTCHMQGRPTVPVLSPNLKTFLLHEKVRCVYMALFRSDM